MARAMALMTDHKNVRRLLIMRQWYLIARTQSSKHENVGATIRRHSGIEDACLGLSVLLAIAYILTLKCMDRAAGAPGAGPLDRWLHGAGLPALEGLCALQGGCDWGEHADACKHFGFSLHLDT